MADLIDKLKQIFASRFPGSTSELEQDAELGKVTGFLYWPGFETDEQIERQGKVKEVLRAELTPEERQHVSVIFTLTPQEVAVMREG